MLELLHQTRNDSLAAAAECRGQRNQMLHSGQVDREVTHVDNQQQTGDQRRPGEVPFRSNGVVGMQTVK